MDIDKKPVNKPWAFAGFTAERKVRCLELVRQTGNVTKSCEMIGISTDTFYGAVANDEEFAHGYKAALDARCDNLEEIVYDSALQPGKNGFMDRMAYLRAHRKGKWGDKVQHEHSNADRVKEISSKAGAYKNSIEGEIVEVPELPPPTSPSEGDGKPS